MEVATQILWCIALWYCCFANYDAFRFRKMPMRLLGLVGALIAAWYGIVSLDHLQQMLRGLEPVRVLGLEIFISIGLAAWFHYPMDGEILRGRRIRLHRAQ